MGDRKNLDDPARENVHNQLLGTARSNSIALRQFTVGAGGLVLLLVVYVGTYLAMANPNWPRPGLVAESVPEYRVGRGPAPAQSFWQYLFGPANLIDRQVRPEHWAARHVPE